MAQKTAIGRDEDKARLMRFAGDLATAARQYTSYNFASVDGWLSYIETRRSPEQMRKDLMILTSAIADVGTVGSALLDGKPKSIVDTCGYIARRLRLQVYGSDAMQQADRETFGLWSKLVDFDGALAALEALERAGRDALRVAGEPE